MQPKRCSPAFEWSTWPTRRARPAAGSSPTSAPTSSASSPRRRRSRRLPPFHGATSLSFAVRNANKRGVTLDLAAPAERERLLALLESADIWIETTRPGSLGGARARP